VFTGTIPNHEELAEFASTGVYLSFDLFGIEMSYYQVKIQALMNLKMVIQLAKIDFPSDAQRMDMIASLIRGQKKEDRILLAHDIHTKHRLV